ncbi:hypothetical protein ACHAW6_000973 [Cyclotella cf. meneghiniana]
MRGYHPQLHKLDTKSSHNVETFKTENNTSFQYTPPEIPQTNIAKRANRTWKNHFVAKRAGAAKSYHLSYWCKDLEQTEITLNMMGPCTQHPNLSVDKALDGMFSFDATPMAPLGTKFMLHVKPTCRHTWVYHSIKDWYFAPALNRYHCIKVVTDTGAVHLDDTFTFLHHSLPTPTISNADCIIKAIQHLNKTIMTQPPTQPDRLEAITNLCNLISITKPSAPSDTTNNNTLQNRGTTTSRNVQTTSAPAGLLANKLLASHLDAAGYYQCQSTLGLWITFSLVVDDFGVKTFGLTHAKHLKDMLQRYYKVSVNWTGKLFCGIS